MRFAIRLLVPLTAVAFVACSGSAPLPVAQRFPTAADAPGSKPDPVEKGETTENLDEFIDIFRPALIDPDDEEVTTVFQEAGFNGAGLDVRFLGDAHSPPRHISSAGSWSLTPKTERRAHLTSSKRTR